ncbi:MAG: hypothetical protein NZ519_06915 [Bacteroidia bacterium]|nr:hypothetical protein [Bacteroidia bacterium]
MPLGSAKRSEAPKRKRSAECPDPCAARGTPKIKLFFRLPHPAAHFI